MAGDYKVLLPGFGEHTIRIEYLNYTQSITFTIREDGGVEIV